MSGQEWFEALSQEELQELSALDAEIRENGRQFRRHHSRLVYRQVIQVAESRQPEDLEESELVGAF